ncbi:trypsin-like serine protease [Microvirga makkahensis]|uniref:Trypsin-like serine protease n=2 Tax=Microvirga makkahensis TaxID=1128670 RepID=A0A7X3SQY4_9HYPH|nr:trypsin-like serine protease [Microvirga makkahensis]
MNRLITLAFALSLAASGAKAIVGGAEDQGPLARQSVMVLSSNGGVCSAVVVARDVVLTAAHCVTGADEHRVHFRDEAGEPVLIPPAAKAVHPSYNAKAIETRQRSIDLALVRIPQPLPERFERAQLTPAKPPKGETVTIGGYGVAQEGDGKSSGTFRTADLRAIEPFGSSQLLVWLEGVVTGACQGDSGGPVMQGGNVFAITTWAKGAGRSSCGRISQGILLGPQKEWIDRTLRTWNRAASWTGG